MTSVLRNEIETPGEAFKEFFRSYRSDQNGSKYCTLLTQISARGEKSLLVEFEDLIAFDPALARNIVERPDPFIGFATMAATAQMRLEDPDYASHVGTIFARFRGLPEKISPRRLSAKDIRKLVSVRGTITKAGRVDVMLLRAAFRCRKCLEITVQGEEGELVQGPGSRCQFCKQTTSFALLEEESKFIDCQNVTIEDSSPSAPDRTISLSQVDAVLKRDLVDTVQVKDEVDVTGIVNVNLSKRGRGGRGRLALYLDANYIERAREQIATFSPAL